MKDGKVLRIYKHVKFPKLAVQADNDVPRSSVYWRTTTPKVELSKLTQVAAGQWLESDWGKPLPDLFEQVLYQQMGYALVLLWPELKEDDEDFDLDEERTSKQRLAERRGRWTER